MSGQSMDSGYSNNIFFVKNRIEKFIPHMEKVCGRFNFNHTPLEGLAECIKSRQRKVKIKNRDQYTLEQNLVIIDKEFYDENQKVVSENIFLTNPHSNPPHFLYITTSSQFNFEQSSLEFDDDDFYYYVSPGEDSSGEMSINHTFLALLFKCIANRKRVHNYIVNSFQTIVESTIIAKQKVQIEKLYSELEALSKIDVLTNVLSRKAFFEAMELEKARTLRDFKRLNDVDEKGEIKPNVENITQHYGRFACLMIDIDGFKQINDTYGHLIGDEVLKKLGQMLSDSSLFRDNDIIGRYGGEEFVVILPETNAEHARTPAERLRKAVKGIQFTSNKGVFTVTISVGISEFKTRDNSCDDVIARADKALYHAKNNGKDRVVLAGEIEE